MANPVVRPDRGLPVVAREQNLVTIEDLKRTSLDYYAASRTLYRQLRAKDIRNGAAAPRDDIYEEAPNEIDAP